MKIEIFLIPLLAAQIELRGNGLSDKPQFFGQRKRWWTIDDMCVDESFNWIAMLFSVYIS
jgi:hypothetical protein